MTTVEPAGLNVRECRLYRFYVEHPLTGQEVLGYVGETIREPFERLLEHVRDQPWIDTVTRWERDPRVFGSKAEVLAAEAAAIAAERPLYNVLGNEGNPLRIPPPEAIRQRRQRDLEQGRPRWQHPDDRMMARGNVRTMAESRVSVPRRWSAPQVKCCLWSVTWALLTVVSWAGQRHYDLAGTWQQHLLSASLAALILLGWGLVGAPVNRRQWRKVRRRGWKRLLRW